MKQIALILLSLTMFSIVSCTSTPPDLGVINVSYDKNWNVDYSLTSEDANAKIKIEYFSVEANLNNKVWTFSPQCIQYEIDKKKHYCYLSPAKSLKEVVVTIKDDSGKTRYMNTVNLINDFVYATKSPFISSRIIQSNPTQIKMLFYVSDIHNQEAL